MNEKEKAEEILEEIRNLITEYREDYNEMPNSIFISDSYLYIIKRAAKRKYKEQLAIFGLEVIPVLNDGYISVGKIYKGDLCDGFL